MLRRWKRTSGGLTELYKYYVYATGVQIPTRRRPEAGISRYRRGAGVTTVPWTNARAKKLLAGGTLRCYSGADLEEAVPGANAHAR